MKSNLYPHPYAAETGHYLVLVLGIMIAIAAIITAIPCFSFVRKGQKVKAVIVNTIKYTDNEDGDHYIPLYKFRTAEGQEYTYEGSSDTHPVWKNGNETVLMYAPDDPANARPITFWGLFKTPVVLGMIALPLLFAGISYFATASYLKQVATPPYETGPVTK